MVNEKPMTVSDKVKGIYLVLEAKEKTLRERTQSYRTDPLHDLDLPPEVKEAIYERVVSPRRDNSRITSDLEGRANKIRKYLDDFAERNGRFVEFDDSKEREWEPAKPYIDREKREKQNKGDPVYQNLKLIEQILGHWKWVQCSGGRRSEGFWLRSFDKSVYNTTSKFVEEAGDRFRRREMTEEEYRSILSETHPAIIGLKACDALKPYYIKNDSLVDLDGHSIISPAEWIDGKDADFLKRGPQEFVENVPTNPVEEKPSIIFGDFAEYKNEMGKLAERFGGNEL